jgi:hypothetical protein
LFSPFVVFVRDGGSAAASSHQAAVGRQDGPIGVKDL